jgi:hypothetical protein
MGNVLAFIIGCLVTVWWRAKPNNKESSRAASQVTSTGTQYLNKAKRGLRKAGQWVTEIQVARVSKQPTIDDELKDILLEYMIEQIKKGKIKIIEDID